jgi:hypothetical protein
MQAIRRPSVGVTWDVEDWPNAVSGVAAACTRVACVASAVGLPARPHVPCEEHLERGYFHALGMYDVTVRPTLAVVWAAFVAGWPECLTLR